MTRPVTIFLGPDGTGSPIPKILLRMLLYSTSDRGQYIEALFVRAIKGNDSKDFNIWVYRQSSGLVGGSGLYVSRQGIATDHHFMLHDVFIFKGGEYQIEVYVKIVGRRLELIHSQSLTISKQEAKRMKVKDAGIYFDWNPGKEMYSSVVDKAAKELP